MLLVAELQDFSGDYPHTSLPNLLLSILVFLVLCSRTNPLSYSH